MNGSRRRRILVLAPRNPYPVIGGDRVRIHRIARELARHHDLTLLTICRSRAERDALPASDDIFKEIVSVVMPTWRSCFNALAALPTREPLQVAFYRSSRFRTAVEALAPSHDAVLAHLVRTAGYARNAPGVRILEMTDAISMNLTRVTAVNAGYFDVRQLIYAIEARRMRAYERRIAADFDVVTLTSAVDKAFLFGGTSDANLPVMVVPNGVDAPDATPPAQADRRPGEIAFVGHLGALPNFDAAWFFARRVLPLIRAERPHAVFRIIGPVRSMAARQLAALPGVRLDGIVPCIETALATARVGVCPTRAGSGIQNKVLDYFGSGVAVVCSPVAAEGLEAVPDRDMLLAATPEEWATQVLRLLDDESLAQRLANAGRRLALNRYRWEQRVLPLVSRLDRLFEQHNRAASVSDEGADASSLAPVLAKT